MMREPSVFPFARTMVRRETAASTSDLARRLLEEGIAVDGLPLLVVAERQTAGRGRGTNAWWSDSGSLTFTVAFDAASHGLRPEQEPRIALAAAVIMIEAIQSFTRGLALGIRWPNDVESAAGKLGGILPERVDTALGPRMLVGIGLNVHTRLDDAPAEVRNMAASLAGLGAGRLSKDDVLHAILTRFAPMLEALARDDAAFARRWQELDILKGRPLQVLLGSELLEGVGGGIDAHGALRLLGPAGEVTLFAGQVLRA